MAADNFCFYLQNRLIQIRRTGGQWYSDTSSFSIPFIESVPRKHFSQVFLYVSISTRDPKYEGLNLVSAGLGIKNFG